MLNLLWLGVSWRTYPQGLLIGRRGVTLFLGGEQVQASRLINHILLSHVNGASYSSGLMKFPHERLGIRT